MSEKRNSDAMKLEIEDLLKVIDKLEESLGKSEHEVEMVGKENAVLFKEVENVTKELGYKIEELYDCDEKYRKTKEALLLLQ